METFCNYKPEQQAAHENEFKARNIAHLDELENEKGVKLGDMVVVSNGYGLPVGPFKVLGFKVVQWSPESKPAPAVFLSWDCFWYPAEISDIIEIVNK